MNCIIPYTKEIEFNTKIAEISSISLEHEMNINEGEILGNFIINGEYKSHELSVNKEDFEHILPFSIDISDNLIKNTIKFDITDFSYEILKDNILKVMIEFTVSGDEREEVEEIEVDTREELFESPEEASFIDEVIPEEELNLEVTEEKSKEIREEKEANIINSANNASDTYKTYHIHIVKENETIEAICTMYNTNQNLILEYNDINEIIPGDKLIIPEDD